jgi:hypothetical protein
MRASVRVVVVSLIFAVLSARAATNPPVITSLTPKDTIAGTGQITIDINGANFISGAVVRSNSINKTTTFVSSTLLRFTLSASDVNAAANLSITVLNPSGGGTSSAVTFTVLPNNPIIASVTPSSVPVNSSDLAIHINGSNFASTAKVRINNTDRVTTFIDSSNLDATLLASDVSSARTLSVTVANPNLKVSSAVSLPVTAGTPAPSITLLSPDSVSEDSGQFTLTVFGQNFVNNAVVRLNGSSRTTTFVNSGQLTATIFASDIINPGTAQISVRNPDAKISANSVLTITPANQPVIKSISPSSVTAKGSGFTLTVTGTNFLQGATIKVNTISHATTFVNSTTVTTTITSSEISNPGQLQITVTNPGAGSPTTAAMTLTVVDANAPAITGLNPSSVVVGTGSVKVLVNGSGFINTDSVLFNGSKRTTEFASASQLAVTLTDSDVAVVGQFPIAVQHQLNSVTSAPATFNVTAATSGPVISFLNPSTAAVNGAPFTLRVIGSGFTNDSIVSVDNVARTTTFVNSAQLTVSIFASDLSSVRQIPIVVTTPGQTPSVPVNLNVAVVPPVITSLSPSSVIGGNTGLSLTVSGTGFSSSSVINVAGVPHLTQLDAATGTLSTSVLANEIVTAGTLSVTVTDRGITSASSPLTVLRPIIISIDPAAVTAGSRDIRFTVTANNILPTSVIVVGGTVKETVYNAGDSTLTATLSEADLAVPGGFAVVVRNTPTTVSAPVLLSVVSPGTPAILGTDPVAIAAGSSGQVLTVVGVNFIPDSRIFVNGQPRLTVFISTTELHSNLTTAELTNPGTLIITVVNPDGATSAAAAITITGDTLPPPRPRPSRH